MNGPIALRLLAFSYRRSILLFQTFPELNSCAPCEIHVELCLSAYDRVSPSLLWGSVGVFVARRVKNNRCSLEIIHV